MTTANGEMEFDLIQFLNHLVHDKTSETHSYLVCIPSLFQSEFAPLLELLLITSIIPGQNDLKSLLPSVVFCDLYLFIYF